MNSNLMHAASERLAEHNARRSIVAELLELGRAILALWRDFADANLVADHLDRLLALNDFTVGGKESK